MITTMCSIFGIVSVPSGSVGFGRDPGLRVTAGLRVLGVVGGPGRVDVFVPFDDLDDELQPARFAATRPAPAMPIPWRRRRREREVSMSTNTLPSAPRA